MKQRHYMARKRLTCSRPCHIRSNKTFFSIINPLYWRHDTWLCQCRNLLNFRHAVSKDMFLLQMRYERIKSRVIGNDMEISVFISHGDTPNVKSDVKIKRVVSRTCHFHIFSARAEFLDCLDHGEWQLRLILSHKQKHPDPFLIKKVKIIGRYILEINQHVISFHVTLRFPSIDLIDVGRGATALPIFTSSAIHGTCPSAHIVMKYHADDTSIDNGPRWFKRLRVG